MYKVTETATNAPTQAQKQNVPNRYALIQASVNSIKRYISLLGSQLSA